MDDAPPPLQIGMLLYPGITLLDLIGPYDVLSPHSKIHLLWKSLDVVRAETGVGMLPTTTLDRCPDTLDILFVPGGVGTIDFLEDEEILGFLRRCADSARYVTSVCTGSLLLGAAGLLDGYKATTHWAFHDLLPLFGAEAVKARVVADGNLITAGGVTAGIDFGLSLLARLRGDDIAKLTQLMLEYDPAPPFHAGTPAAAGPQLTRQLRQLIEPTARRIRQVSDRIADRQARR